MKDKIDSKGFVILWVETGIHGLPYAGIIAQKNLEKRLKKERYTQSD